MRGAQIFRAGAVFSMPRNILSFLIDTFLGGLTNHFPNATRGFSISWQTPRDIVVLVCDMAISRKDFT